MDGMVVLAPSPSKAHNRVAMKLAVALDAAAGPDWLSVTDVDPRLRDVPLLNRRPDVAVVFRAESLEAAPMRPEHVLLVAEIVSPGSETTDRRLKPDEHATAGIEYYWRVEQVGVGVPVVHTYVLDPAAKVYRPTDVFTGVVDANAPFAVQIDLREI
jgi:Uma2 family endonuclease